LSTAWRYGQQREQVELIVGISQCGEQAYAAVGFLGEHDSCDRTDEATDDLLDRIAVPCYRCAITSATQLLVRSLPNRIAVHDSRDSTSLSAGEGMSVLVACTPEMDFVADEISSDAEISSVRKINCD
jgi:hypothetical protein